MDITKELARKLIQEQFPKWSHLEIYPVERSGHDNRTFHLGDTMTIRLPSAEGYASQVDKENKWLPYLQSFLDFPISKPLEIGKANQEYPYPWSINQWIEGDTLLECENIDKGIFARKLANALQQLQSIDCSDGPKAGIHNYYRGGDLKVYHQETLAALELVKDYLPSDILLEIWQECIATVYQGDDVWVHGDIAPGNILLKDNQFHGLIDFGVLGTGDPACDYAMAWTYFDKEDRDIFLHDLPTDMMNRARGWALWKALITYCDHNQVVMENARLTIKVILEEYYEYNK